MQSSSHELSTMVANSMYIYIKDVYVKNPLAYAGNDDSSAVRFQSQLEAFRISSCSEEL